MSQMSDILDNMLAHAYSDEELLALPCAGESPWGSLRVPAMVWAWNEWDDEVIVGDDELAIVSYDKARDMYGGV